MSYFELLRRLPSLRILILSQIPADLSDWLDYIALGVLLGFAWKVDPVVFAWLGAAMGIPYLVVGPIAGALADRWSFRDVLVASNALRALATFSLFFVSEVVWLLVVIFLRSSADAFYSPAKQVAITAIVPGGQRMMANGLSHAINQASKLLGPSCGAALLLAIYARYIFVVNGCISALAACILLSLRTASGAKETDLGGHKPALAHQILDGFREVASKPVLCLSIAMMTTSYFSIFIYDRFIPLLVSDFGFSGQVFSFSIACVGAGGVVGALVVGRVNHATRTFDPVIVGALGVGIVLFLIGGASIHGITLPAAGFIGAFGALGILTSLVLVPFRTILQRETDASRIGRVFAVNDALNVGAMLSAPFIGAVIAEAFGTSMPFISGSVGMIGVFLLAIAARRRFARQGRPGPNP